MIILDSLLDSPLIIGGLVALSMILDIWVTRYTFRLSQQEYAKHFLTDRFEMNPYLYETIHKERSLSKKQILVRIGVVGAIVVLSAKSTGTWEHEIFCGVLLLTYLGLILRNLEITCTSWILKNHPDYIEGQIKIDIRYQYKSMRMQHVTYALIWLTIYFLIGRAFFLGGVVGSGFALIGTSLWKRTALKKFKQG